ncbi:hypothetical protein ACFL2Q_06365 [Thermodesulfobacteriota bacterium]
MVKLSRTYPWRRLWRRLVQEDREERGQTPAGGLPSRGEASVLQESVTFDEIRNERCLILLGGPGMGKTAWFEEREDAMSDGIRAAGDFSLWLNLRR